MDKVNHSRDKPLTERIIQMAFRDRLIVGTYKPRVRVDDIAKGNNGKQELRNLKYLLSDPFNSHTEKVLGAAQKKQIRDIILHDFSIYDISSGRVSNGPVIKVNADGPVFAYSPQKDVEFDLGREDIGTDAHRIESRAMGEGKGAYKIHGKVYIGPYAIEGDFNLHIEQKNDLTRRTLTSVQNASIIGARMNRVFYKSNKQDMTGFFLGDIFCPVTSVTAKDPNFVAGVQKNLQKMFGFENDGFLVLNTSKGYDAFEPLEEFKR